MIWFGINIKKSEFEKLKEYTNLCFKSSKMKLAFILPLHFMCHKVVFEMMNYSFIENMLDFHMEIIPLMWFSQRIFHLL